LSFEKSKYNPLKAGNDSLLDNLDQLQRKLENPRSRMFYDIAPKGQAMYEHLDESLHRASPNLTLAEEIGDKLESVSTLGDFEFDNRPIQSKLSTVKTIGVLKIETPYKKAVKRAKKVGR
jgi:hypothetical protein